MERPDNPYAPPVAAVPYALPAVPGQLDLASRGSRYLAALVDSVAFMVAFIPAVVIVVATAPSGGGTPSDGSLILGGIALLLGVVGVVAINIRLVAQRAQTLGKLALGVRVVMLDGRQADFGTIALKRFLPMFGLAMIPLLGSIISLVDTVMIFRADRRCLHDLIAGTAVVRA